MMKKRLAGLLVLGLVFGLAACGGKTGESGGSSSASESAGASESGGS